jgi:hypothetical protein
MQKVVRSAREYAKAFLCDSFASVPPIEVLLVGYLRYHAHTNPGKRRAGRLRPGFGPGSCSQQPASLQLLESQTLKIHKLKRYKTQLATITGIRPLHLIADFGS